MSSNKEGVVLTKENEQEKMIDHPTVKRFGIFDVLSALQSIAASLVAVVELLQKILSDFPSTKAGK